MRGQNRRAAALALITLLAACGGGGGGRITLTGTMTLPLCSPGDCAGADQTQAAFPQYAIGQPCASGGGGFSDISDGTQVTVKNEKSAVIASGTLQGGVWIRQACQWTFTIPAVPNARFYSVEVSHRGAQTASRSDLQAKKYHLDFTLGP